MGLRGRISDIAVEREIEAAGASKPVKPERLDKAASAEWERVTSLLDERGLLDRIDEAGLHDYLTCWRRLRECEAEITANGLTLTGTGGRVKNPACTLAGQYRASMLAWSKELGLTLASRLRMQIARNGPPMVDPYGDLD